MVRLAQLPQAFRSIKRVPQIASVLMKFGFGDVVNRMGLDTLLHDLKAKVFSDTPPEYAGLRTEERIRLSLEELGPTFVKFGQIMATRPDLIPMSLVVELRKLQDKVAPFDTTGIKAHVEKELGRKLDEIFSDFDEQPLAAASIAQVHRATLKDGKKVVLKIQRPNLDRQISTDLDIIAWLAEVMEERLPETRRYSPTAAVREFKKSISKEIDFEREAYNMKRYARNFRDDPAVYVPKVYDEFTNAKILTEEFIEGIKVDSKAIKERASLDRETIAKNGIRIVIESVFIHGFFHADPHPGNIFLLEGNRVCMIDYGMMGVLDQERIDELLVFLTALLTKNTDKLIRLFFKLGLIGEATDVRALRTDCDDLLNRYEMVELAKVDTGRLIQQLFDVITRHDIILPADLLIMGKALATIDGVARDIYPELDPLNAIRPHVLRIYMRRLADPAFFSREPMRVAEELWYLAQTAPRDLRILLRHLRDGRAKIGIELEGLDANVKKSAQALNRLSLSVVMGAIIMGSCYLLVQSNLKPLIGEFPIQSILGLLGIGIACFYGFVLFIGFLRSGGV
ncbi:MAG: ABC1 kinase family protein [Planctomycetota bacterium]